jgi:hypothetical protein
MARKFILALGAVLLIQPFMAATASADEVPVSMKWVGMVFDLAIDTNGDGLFADLIDAQGNGTFGPAELNVLTEFFPVGFCDTEYKVLQLGVLYSKPITTFLKGDQLWGNVTGGSMCLDTETGEFEGEAAGNYVDGTGRFKGASGWFTVKFEGTNVTFAEELPGFGAISGTIKGVVERP